MKMIGALIDDKTAERFRALAPDHGGRSALLRRMVQQVVDGSKSPDPVPSLPEPKGPTMHLSIRLHASEVAAVAQAAKARGMKPSQWLRAVVRNRLGGGTQYTRDELHELRALANQVRKIGVNLNQIARAANQARLEGAGFSVDTKALKAAQAEAALTLDALHAMAQGNARFWEGTGDE